MIRAYKYRIYPTPEQRGLIDKTFGVCRLVYNIALQVKSEAYKAHGANLSSYDLMRQLTEMKQGYEWMQEVDSQALQSAIMNMDVAYKNFFRGSGFPKFKDKRGRQSFQCRNNTRIIDFENGLLSIPKIKDIPIKVSRTFEGKIKIITISRTVTGKYFASAIFEVDTTPLPKSPIKENTTIGVDLGIKHFVALSDGSKIDNPKYYKENLSRLKCLQRRASRKKKGSNNRKKANKSAALRHESIFNQRQDFLHKLSSAITKQYDSVCVEDLAVSNMVQNRKLSQAIWDAGWGEFTRQLNYKCEWKGKNYFEVPRFFASSKTCYDCGVVNETLTLADREWTCANCGAIHDRDVSAAKNIKQYFLTNSPEGIRGEPVELSPLGGAKKQEDIAKVTP